MSAESFAEWQSESMRLFHRIRFDEQRMTL